jgi:hypothetical protein
MATYSPDRRPRAERGLGNALFRVSVEAFPRRHAKAVREHRSPRRWREYASASGIAKRLGLRRSSAAFARRVGRKEAQKAQKGIRW